MIKTVLRFGHNEIMSHFSLMFYKVYFYWHKLLQASIFYFLQKKKKKFSRSNGDLPFPRIHTSATCFHKIPQSIKMQFLSDPFVTFKFFQLSRNFKIKFLVIFMVLSNFVKLFVPCTYYCEQPLSETMMWIRTVYCN